MQQYSNQFAIPLDTTDFMSVQDLRNRREQAKAEASRLNMQRIEQELAAQQAQAQSQPQAQQSAREARQANLNPLVNAALDVSEIGTGLAYMGAHPIETLKTIGDYFKPSFTSENYYKNQGNLAKMALDPAVRLHDFLLANYDVKASDYADIVNGKQTLGQVIGRAAYNAYKNPVSTALDLASFGVLGKAGTVATKAGQVENAVNLARQKVRSKGQKFIDTSEEFNKVGTEADRIAAIEALETGKEVTGNAKKATKVLSKMVDEYDAMIPQYAKVNNFELAHNQRMIREGKAGTIAEAEAQLERFKNPEIVDETLGLEEGLKQLEKGTKPVSQIDFNLVKQAAKEGDELANDILKSRELFDKKYLKPVPHGIAEVAKSVEGAEAVNDMKRLFAGQYSTRAFGNAEYADIAKQLERPDLWADSQMKAFVEGTIAEELAKTGKMGGADIILENTKPADVRYLDRSLLEQGKLTEAVGRAIDNTPKNPTDIPIDKAVLGELKKQLDTTNGVKPFGNSVANDMYSTGKQMALASGGYLAGNFYTGTLNALMNAGLNPVGMARDFAEAVATKGKLIKEAGIYRPVKRTKSRMETKPFQVLEKANKPISDFLNAIDAKMQNTLAEMAIHRNLRGKGIQFGNRANALENMDKVALAEVIRDGTSVALLHPSRTLLPKSLHGVVGMVNPFWRWMDTAAQASYYMIKKHPIVSDLIYNKFAGDIAFDKEMQDRLNLKVSSDKPFVSYRYNPYTQQVDEVSSEFLPAMNSMKFVGETARAIDKGDILDLPIKITPDSIPLWSAIVNASKGVNKYGKPIRRPEMDRQTQSAMEIINGSRRRYNPETREWERVGTQADEVLGTAIQEMIAPARVFNKTVAPAMAGVYNFFTGDNIRYYQPYANQSIGEFARGGEVPSYANPRSSRAGLESINTLLGQYTRPYDEEYETNKDRVSPAAFLKARRGDARYNVRTEEILNRNR